MNHRLGTFSAALVALAIISQCRCVQATIQPETATATQQPASSDRPFVDKPLVRAHIHAEPEAHFVPWTRGTVPIGNYNPEFFERTRVGTIALSPTVLVHIDTIADKVHYPSYFELLDAKSGAVLDRFALFNLDDAEWYFPGNGIAYLNQTHLSLCGPRYTRKIAIKGKVLGEVHQPLIYIGAESNVEESTPLYESPAKKTVVATVMANTKVFVLGLQPDSVDEERSALLVKTPLGLTGWHLRQGNVGEGKLTIYQCN